MSIKPSINMIEDITSTDAMRWKLWLFHMDELELDSTLTEYLKLHPATQVMQSTK
jgi:hypothetical protein